MSFRRLEENLFLVLFRFYIVGTSCTSIWLFLRKLFWKLRREKRRSLYKAFFLHYETRSLCMFIRLCWYGNRDLYAEIVEECAFLREICVLDCPPFWSLGSTLCHSARGNSVLESVAIESHNRCGTCNKSGTKSNSVTDSMIFLCGESNDVTSLSSYAYISGPLFLNSLKAAPFQPPIRKKTCICFEPKKRNKRTYYHLVFFPAMEPKKETQRVTTSTYCARSQPPVREAVRHFFFNIYMCLTYLCVTYMCMSE